MEKGSRMHHEYLKSETISHMCPQRQEMKYIESCARNDEKTRDMLTKFLKTGKVNPEFAGIGNYYKNICYLNKTRRKATKLCCNAFVKKKKHCEINFKYDGKIETYRVAEGMLLSFVTKKKT